MQVWIVLGFLVLAGIGFWVVSTLAEALSGMPQWMRREHRRRARELAAGDQLRRQTDAEFTRRVENGEKLTEADWHEILERKLREHPDVQS